MAVNFIHERSRIIALELPRMVAIEVEGYAAIPCVFRDATNEVKVDVLETMRAR
jgi:hypothetical protein